MADKKIDMFSDTAEKKTTSPFYAVKNFAEQQTEPAVSMLNGFYKSTARTSAIYVIRTIENIVSKNLKLKKNKGEYIDNIQREIKIKSGFLDAETVVRDSLINRHLS